jgi:phage FluMu protein Com
MISTRSEEPGSSQTRKQAVAEASSSRVVPKPVPESQAQDPRAYQIEQLQRRYSPKEATAPDGATSLLFKIKPSDPDFPFELAALECDLRVPQAYPDEKPVLHVKNKDIPRGFGINIERGWDGLVEKRPDATLLAHTRELDKNLEKFLSEQKAETVKLVTFRDTRHVEAQKAQTQETTQPKQEQVSEPAPPKPTPAPYRYVPEPSYTREEITAAKERRALEIRQLEARMKRTPEYRRSPDGVVYTLPLQPQKRSELPPGLQSVMSLHLIIPLIYPLQNLRIQLNNVEPEDAEPVEDLFCEKAAEQQHMSLMSHLNYLAQNIHRLAKQAQAQTPKVEPVAPVPEEQSQDSKEAEPKSENSHIQVIPRPPEWNNAAGDESEEESSSDDTDDGGAVLENEEKETQVPMPGETPERGTMLSFPSIELHGIEILQLSILSLSVKCERCRTVNEVTSLKPDVEKTTSCKKCATPFAVKYRATLVHEHSTRAGFLDLSGCKVADMLPSTFVPTCERCSTPAPGLVSVQGSSVTNVCRDCHGHFTFKIPQVKFLFITPGSRPPPTTGPRRKQEKLGLHAGEQLPSKGTCSHYRKSYRWFRFSCCSRVHPCDKCHDSQEDHLNEWANRIVCGWCSREQNYSSAVEACRFCGRYLIGRKGRGFWEGGKGTRDRRMMSRKDPRKYKRIGGSAAKETT